MYTQVSKKVFLYKHNQVGVKVEKLEDENHYRVIVVCVRHKKKVRGLLTCQEAGIKPAIKRLLKSQVME